MENKLDNCVYELWRNCSDYYFIATSLGRGKCCHVTESHHYIQYMFIKLALVEEYHAEVERPYRRANGFSEENV